MGIYVPCNKEPIRKIIMEYKLLMALAIDNVTLMIGCRHRLTTPLRHGMSTLIALRCHEALYAGDGFKTIRSC